MMHVSPLIGVDHPIDYNITSNYTPDILSCYLECQNQEHGPYQWCSGPKTMRHTCIYCPIIL